MHRRAVITILGGGLALASPERSPHAAEKIAWDGPHCIAYDPVDRAYACLDFSVGADAGDPGLVDFASWTPPPDTAWRGHRGLVLVGRTHHRIPIADKAYGRSGHVRRHRSDAGALARARARGYLREVTERVALPDGAWTEFHGVWLRFASRLHEGSASYRHHGSLRLSCTPPLDQHAGVPVVDDNGAASAVAQASGAADAIVVGFVEVAGGEGAESYGTGYVRIDLRARCSHARDLHARPSH